MNTPVDNAPTTWRSMGLRFLKFSVVGASGVVVNEALFALGTEILFASLAVSARNVTSGVVAVAVSIVTNFVLNDIWTWRDRRTPDRVRWWVRLAKYTAVAALAGAVQIAVMWFTSVELGIHHLLANLLGIGVGVAINFVANNLWTFRRRPETDRDDRVDPGVEDDAVATAGASDGTA